MIKIDLRLLQRAFLDLDVRFRLMERGDGLIEFGLARNSVSRPVPRFASR